MSANYFQKKKGKQLVETKNHLILIAGGTDKNLEFKELGDLITQKVKEVILLEGPATDKLEAAINGRIPTKRVDSMEKAVLTASQLALSGDVVLLSPGCASFGLFRHEFERGSKFNDAVALLKK